ncbi:hypothetical protein EYC80_008253 [Monilinia laxa]|uniref:Uncharacterized protein n=1 Tax=Monilinia laxa TaxID=61186 RepID=A0A5N6JVR6_MONLA|nr:hypothetical protein EYC80_008253 [Monilinia laxa]
MIHHTINLQTPQTIHSTDTFQRARASQNQEMALAAQIDYPTINFKIRPQPYVRSSRKPDFLATGKKPASANTLGSSDEPQDISRDGRTAEVKIR